MEPSFKILSLDQTDFQLFSSPAEDHAGCRKRRGLGAETGRRLKRVLACGTGSRCLLSWIIAVVRGPVVHDGRGQVESRVGGIMW